MEITNLKLVNYRNHTNKNWSFKNGVNIICGKNARGKTNMLEAIHFCAIAKSLRLSKETELIEFNKDFSRIHLSAKKNVGTVTVEITLSKKQKKQIKINEITVLKVSELLGTVPTVYFCPDELKLVKDAPEHRRKFLDIALSQLSKTYFYALLRYEKILDQRNKLLKTAISLEQIMPSLEIFTRQLIGEGAKIIKARIEFIELLKPELKKAHSYLSGGLEEANIEYVGVVSNNIEDISNKLEKEYTKALEKDFLQRHTTVGPHRDDLKITLNNLDLRLYGSQGQQRTATLALKLAETEIFKHNIGEYPVLLLDDVLSELDENRKQNLLNYCSRLQTILTTTEIEEQNTYNIISLN